ncbi:MAG: penicillin-binding protein 1A [Gemmatimonadaceae bacterium]
MSPRRAAGIPQSNSPPPRRVFFTSLLIAVTILLFLRPLHAQEGANQAGDAWRIIRPPQSSLVFARDGSLVGEIGKQWRTSISIKTLPKYIAQAFVAVEDQRFYEHDGVDVIGIAGALKDIARGEPRGASTITQQLVGNMHPSIVDRADRSLGRKLREQTAAREMERRYTKEQILEAYLNQIHFGHGWYGIEAAARHYFGKRATSLTLAEAATLAALPKGPALYSPIRHADRARARRNLVLGLMADQRFITQAQASAAKLQHVVTAPNAGMPVAAPYLVDAVRRRAESTGISLAEGGFRVHTTLDVALQSAADYALREGATRLEAREGYKWPTYRQHSKGEPGYLQGAVVAMDAASGDVLALIGGRDFAQSPFNRATQAMRQPGSAFKPIVYAAAIADSIPASEILADTALAIEMGNGTVYRPQNSDELFAGSLTMREALVRSRNSVAVQLGIRVGLDSVAELARRIGIETPIALYPSSAIGASEVRPMDFIASYSVFANLGGTVEPRMILRVDDSAGRTVFTAPPRAPRQVLDSAVAFIVRDMMRDAVDRGTGQAVRRHAPNSISVAGKTGTTDDNSDVWFVGMTPEIVAGVWLGFDKPKLIAPGAAGGSLAAPIWGDMIARYYQGREAGSWTIPEGIVTAEMDRETGAPADITTPPERRYTEYFLDGAEPFPSPWKVFMWGPVGS